MIDFFKWIAWSMSNDPASWVSAICAIIACLAAFLTVWWPWHTRPAPDLQFERSAFSVERETMAHLIMSCNLQRPRLIVRWRNDGDGTAYAVAVEGTSDTCEIRMISPNTNSKIGFDFVERVGRLESGEHFKAIILPTSKVGTHRPSVRISWKESPTRLNVGHKSKQVEMPYRLPGKHPLGYQERILVRHIVSQTAKEHGYPFETFAQEMLGLNLNDIDPMQADDIETCQN